MTKKAQKQAFLKMKVFQEFNRDKNQILFKTKLCRKNYRLRRDLNSNDRVEGTHADP